MKNKDLKEKYDQMHAEGKQAWFDDGWTEPQALFEMGKPWEGKTVLEIGCGEGDLLNMVHEAGAYAEGIDYSKEAIHTCRQRYPHLRVDGGTYQLYVTSEAIPLDVLLMQGVLEHLDDPWEELEAMIEKFEPRTIITSMPGFRNPRGVLWHFIYALGGVVSKTDLHFIDPDDVDAFCKEHGYSWEWNTIEWGWGWGEKMCDDMQQRIPLALKDGGIEYDEDKIKDFMVYLRRFAQTPVIVGNIIGGAVNIYKISL